MLYLFTPYLTIRLYATVYQINTNSVKEVFTKLNTFCAVNIITMIPLKHTSTITMIRLKQYLWYFKKNMYLNLYTFLLYSRVINFLVKILH